MVREAEAARLRGPRGGELDARWGIEFQRGRLGVGEGHVAVPQQQAHVVALDPEWRSSGGGERSDTCAVP